MQHQYTKKQQRIGEATLLFITVIWGSSFVVSHFALAAGLSPLFILMCRFCFAALFIGLLYMRRIKKNFRPAHLKSGILLGIVFGLAFYMQVVGLQLSTPSNNAIITSSNVVIVPFIWWLATKKRPARITFVSCFLCLVAMLIISLDFSQGIALRIGDALSLLSAILFAGQIVLVGEMARRIDHIVVVFMQFAVAGILAAVLFFITDGNLSYFANSTGMLAMVYLVIISTCVCFILQAWAMQRVSSSRAAIIMSTECLFGTLLSIIVGTDVLTWRIAIGALLFFVAVMLPSLSRTKTGQNTEPQQ